MTPVGRHVNQGCITNRKEVKKLHLTTYSRVNRLRRIDSTQLTKPHWENEVQTYLFHSPMIGSFFIGPMSICIPGHAKGPLLGLTNKPRLTPFIYPIRIFSGKPMSDESMIAIIVQSCFGATNGPINGPMAQ